MKRRFRRKLSFKKRVVIIFLITLFIAFVLDFQMRPLVKSVAQAQAQIVSTSVINKVVVDELSRLDIDYSDIIKLQKDENGKILAISTDMKKINFLKSTITMAVQEKVVNMGKHNVKLPIGTFSGTEILNGRGPKIPLHVTMTGSVVTDFKSEFIEAGINQTKHRLYLNISTNVFALIPGFPVNTSVDTDIIVAETVIVGEVPSFFADFSK